MTVLRLTVFGAAATLCASRRQHAAAKASCAARDAMLAGCSKVWLLLVLMGAGAEL